MPSACPGNREWRILIETLRRRYNEDRSHPGLGYRSPMQFKDEYQRQPQSKTSIYRAVLLN